MKTSMIKSSLAALLAVASLTSIASAQDKPVPLITPADVVAVAVSRSELKTLVKALQEAELVTALQDKGPFTVFAPTDAAFAKLPSGELETLLKPENREKLATILKGHVLKGKVTASEITTGKVETLGAPVLITMRDGKVYFGDAKIVSTDLPAANGVVHEIDTVVLPK